MISLNFNEKESLFVQLYEYIKKEIISGSLERDTLLPSKRNLATHLGISINTVIKAYENLIDEGYIYSKERIGYFVSPVENILNIKNNDTIVKKDKKIVSKYNFDLNKNANFSFPNTNYKKVLNESLLEKEELAKRDIKGLYCLRHSIKNYLKSARNVDVSEESIIISSGIEYLFQILFYIMPQDTVFGLENPGYRDLKNLFEMNNKKYVFQNIDSDGIIIENREINAFLITPSHQFPTGNIMPIGRRVELLNYVQKINGYILEDDYDSEFKYYGRPIPALKSLDKPDRVVYISNFSKSISPTLRVSFMVLPKKLLQKYESIKPFYNCPVPNIVQLSLSKYIDEGYFEKHLNRMRRKYDDKRKFTISFFENNKLYKIRDKKAGMHFILEIKTEIKEQEIIKKMKQQNIYVEGLAKYYEGEVKYKYPRIIIGYGNMKDKELKEAIQIFKKVVEDMVRYKKVL